MPRSCPRGAHVFTGPGFVDTFSASWVMRRPPAWPGRTLPAVSDAHVVRCSSYSLRFRSIASLKRARSPSSAKPTFDVLRSRRAARDAHAIYYRAQIIGKGVSVENRESGPTMRTYDSERNGLVHRTSLRTIPSEMAECERPPQPTSGAGREQTPPPQEPETGLAPSLQMPA
jgi:hypothetical protein